MAIIVACVAFAAVAHTAGLGSHYLGAAWGLLALVAASGVCIACWRNSWDMGPMAPVWHFLGSLFYMGLLVWYAPRLAALSGGMPDMADLGFGLVLWAGTPVAVTGAPIWRMLWHSRG